MPANGVPNPALVSFYLALSCSAALAVSPPPPPTFPPPLLAPASACPQLCLGQTVANADTNNAANLVNQAVPAASEDACLQACIGTCGCWAATYVASQARFVLFVLCVLSELCAHQLRLHMSQVALPGHKP